MQFELENGYTLLNNEAAISLWNRLVTADNQAGLVIYDDMVEFFKDSFCDAYEACRACFYGEFRPNDRYIRLNGLGNVLTGDVCEVIDTDELDYLITNYPEEWKAWLDYANDDDYDTPEENDEEGDK